MRAVRTSRTKQAALVAEYMQSGESISTFCTRNGCTAATFQRWQKNLGADVKDVDHATFIPVSIHRSHAISTPDYCILRVGSDISIECRADTPLTALEQALRTALLVCGRN